MGEGRGKHSEREKHQFIASHNHSNQDWTFNLGMCPDWELNPPTVCVQSDAPTEPLARDQHILDSVMQSLDNWQQQNFMIDLFYKDHLV